MSQRRSASRGPDPNRYPRHQRGSVARDQRPDFASDDEAGDSRPLDVEEFAAQTVQARNTRRQQPPSRRSDRLNPRPPTPVTPVGSTSNPYQRLGNQGVSGRGGSGLQRSSRPSGLDVDRANDYAPDLNPRDYPSRAEGSGSSGAATTPSSQWYRSQSSASSTPPVERAQTMQYEAVQRRQQRQQREQRRREAAPRSSPAPQSVPFASSSRQAQSGSASASQKRDRTSSSNSPQPPGKCKYCGSRNLEDMDGAPLCGSCRRWNL